MIPREIGEHRDVRRDARRLFEGDGVRRHLCCDRLHAPRAHLEKQLVELETVRCGEARPHLFAVYIVPFRADDPRRHPRRREDGRDVMRGRRLSVGANHGDELHALGGMPPERRRHLRVRPPHILHQNVGALHFRHPVRDGDERLCLHLSEVRRSVVTHAFHAKKQIAVLHFRRVDLKRPHLEVFIRAHLYGARVRKQFFEPHRHLPHKLYAYVRISYTPMLRRKITRVNGAVK